MQPGAFYFHSRQRSLLWDTVSPFLFFTLLRKNRNKPLLKAGVLQNAGGWLTKFF